MTSCYVNFGYKAEYKSYSPGRRIVENRFYDPQTAMKELVSSSARLSEVRSRTPALETACAPSCAVAAEVMKAIGDELATPSSNPSDRANLQRDFDEYKLAMATACPAAH